VSLTLAVLSRNWTTRCAPTARKGPGLFVSAAVVAVLAAASLFIAISVRIAGSGGWRRAAHDEVPAVPPTAAAVGGSLGLIAAEGRRARLAGLLIRAVLLAGLGLTPLGARFMHQVAPDDSAWRVAAGWLVILAAVTAAGTPVVLWLRRARSRCPALMRPRAGGPRQALGVAFVLCYGAGLTVLVAAGFRSSPGAMLCALAVGFSTGVLVAPVLPHRLRKLPRSQRVAAALESLPEQPRRAARAAEGWVRALPNAGVAPLRPNPVIAVAPPLVAALTDRQLRAIVAHEVAHLEHRDLAHRRLRLWLMIICAGATAVALHGVPVLTGLAGLSSHVTAQSVPFLLAAGYLVFRVLSAVNLPAVRGEERAADRRMMELADDPQACIEGLDAIMSMLGTPDSWTLPQRLLFATHPARQERLGLLRSAASSWSPRSPDTGQAARSPLPDAYR
jgi:heat shock protein HtpX